ncbi:PorP/SprF family type IX secretion system membrane protein [Sediminicola luteus]|uniref:Type IX secretion system membrane protein PorP/SprF n=1 Tax=Sediminicola luteus TaxID=319238 RepID=A0A2A4G9E4_9FLAO|nr:type IX secretion system membrane protein PorP/SprF [Sediminicola luteus]PCE64606.1 hypothetical protein B7P33_10035 [Sediminicola luteus]
MKKIYLTLSIGLLALSQSLWGQQLPQFTQYMYNTISVNPAYAGSRNTLSLTALHRNQWAGLEGNPRTSTLSIHAPLRNDRVGVGFSYINDRLGFEKTNYVYGDFSYAIPVSSEAKLAFGLKAGFTNYQLENPDPTDMFFDADFNKWSPNMGAGVYLSTSRWFAGFSSPRLFNTDLNEGEFKALERNSYYAIGGMVFDLSADLKFRPTAMAKITNGAPASYDVTGTLLWQEKLWIGASYRFNDADGFGAFMDYKIGQQLRIGYAYEQPTGSIRPYTGGTHEIILIFEVLKPKSGKFISPRYF